MKELKTGRPLPEQESRSLDTYLQEIGQSSLLTPEEEKTIDRNQSKGSQKALNRLTRQT